MTFSIRLTEEEERLAKRYAALLGVSLSEAFKRTFFQAIEDEFDVAVGERAYQDYLKNPKTFSFEEIIRMSEELD